MKVLLVNAFQPTPAGNKSFLDFAATVKEAFRAQKFFEVDDIEMTCVDNETIDSYLYEIGTQFLDKNAEKLFDNIDVVIIDGEANLLPWQKRAQKFLILLRMCRRTNKCLFAASCGIQFFVFLCASRFNIRRVINGRGKGSQLSEMQRLTAKQLEHLTQDEVFFDNATGDIYAYDTVSREFYPVSNAGFHYHKAAEESGPLKSAILKANRYQPQQFDDLYLNKPGKLNETTCQTLRPYIQHWLVRDIGLLPFLIPQNSAWDIHPVNMNDKASYFTILAESPRSTQIIYLDNTAAVQFSIDRKYPNTIKILENYLVHIVKLIEETRGRFDKPLASVNYCILPCRPPLNCNPDSAAWHEEADDTKPFLKTSPRWLSRPQTGSTMRPQTGSTRPQTGATRPMTASTVKLTSYIQHTASEATLPKYSMTSTVKNIRHSGYAFSKRHNEKLTVDNNATCSDPVHIDTERKIMKTDSDFISRPKTPGSRIRFQDSTAEADFKPKRKYSALIKNPAADSEPDSPVKMSKSQIRCALHPGYDLKSMPKDRVKIDVFQKPDNVIKIKMKRLPYKSRVNSVSDSQFSKSRTTLYPNLGLTVANDGAPFKSSEEKRLQEELEQKKKWTSAVDFNRVFTKVKSIPQQFHSGVYNPPADHQFRNFDKSRWLHGEFKYPSY